MMLQILQTAARRFVKRAVQSGWAAALAFCAACGEEIGDSTASEDSDGGLDMAHDQDATAHGDDLHDGGYQTADGGGSHAQCTEALAPDPRDDTMTGELVRIVTNDNQTPNDPSDDQYDLLVPQEMLDWLEEQNWIQEHGDWHAVRRCDQSCARATADGLCQAEEALKARGIACAPIQEGEAGDGVAFLAMHRHMLRGFRQAFPKHAGDVLRGFSYIPTTKDDPENPIPWRDIGWSDDQLESISLMEDIGQNLDLFTSEDEYAKWVQFGDGFSGQGGAGGGPGGGFGFPEGGIPAEFLLPDGGIPDFGGGFPGLGGASDGGASAQSDGGTSARPVGGIHTGLHGQWTVPNSPYLLTDNNNNLRNFAFWRLHGWLDDMWERYRVARGLSESDPDYQAELLAQCEEMHELGKALPLDAGTGGQDGGMDAGAETGVFATEVAPIFNSYCSGSQCHGADSATLGLTLAGTQPSVVREGLVGQQSSQQPTLALVQAGQPEQSWIYRKISGDFAGVDCSSGTCSRMPPAGMGLSEEEIERIRSWIAAGATAD